MLQDALVQLLVSAQVLPQLQAAQQQQRVTAMHWVVRALLAEAAAQVQRLQAQPVLLLKQHCHPQQL